ncbi:hypothetical protein A7U60_g5796 [Sanghuangporus baumii]|uniref:Uncharacterized protein n=1 Tax=Sanghuangporus baumii TaxID=108892 RepID=A0A9Q5N7K8_SANBA|nr:hypothetical protein A7U60_g5796 [Sanghuangporus baumii]
MRHKSASSLTSNRQGSPPRDTSARTTRTDPTYAAPSSSGPSRRPNLPGDSVSRFRRTRNTERSSQAHGREYDAARERPVPPEEWRVDERTRQSGSSLSRSQSAVRGYNVHREPYQGSSTHSRAGSEGHRNRPQAKRAPSEPLPRSASAARPSPRSPVSHAGNHAEDSRQHRASPSQRLPPARSYTTPNSSSGNPPRMGRYGIYASPASSSAQIQSTPHQSQEKSLPNRNIQNSYQQHTSSNKRMETWEVKIAPPTTSTSSASASSAGPRSYLRRLAPTRTSDTNSASLTLVSDHPLMDRPLPSPPDKMEAEQAEDFARNLTQRMSVLLEMGDVDFSSPSALASLPEEGSPSSSSSGTATPTGPSTKDNSTQPVDGQPSAAMGNTQSQASSPFGTFLTNAREVNEAFVRGTGSVWDKLFGKNKGKENENAKEPIEGPIDAENVSDLQLKEPHKDSRQDSVEQDIEGSRDIMLYSPLIPDSGSIVELATSEVVTLYGDGADDARERAYRAELRRRWADGRGFVSFDALSSIEPAQEETAESDGSRAQPESDQTVVASDPMDNQQTADDSSKPKPKEKVIWVPSPDKISVQVLWWGYRMYLPPPVLHVLNGRTIETAKRAALLTGALTWLVDNLPLSSLPPVLAPAVLLLKALIPLLGMIGSFVAWSWKATVSFDRGNGVVLSATWVLPIVLVPGTWENGEVPPPPPKTNADEARSTGVEQSRS